MPSSGVSGGDLVHTSFRSLTGRVPYLPVVGRPRLEWPGGARLAVWVVPNVELREYLPDPSAVRDPWPRTPHPDVQQYSFHDYGNRVGVWRLLPILDEFEVPCTVSLNLAVLVHYPELRDAIVERGWEVMSHGVYNTRYLYDLPEDEERALHHEARRLVREHTGQELAGMLGPSLSNSPRTPDLLAEAGYLYHADWALDDQPVPIRVRAGRLVALPYTFELNDAAVFRRHVEAAEWAQWCRWQFERLAREAESDGAGRAMCLSLHPYLVGQPHRAPHLAALLEHLRSREGVWWTTGSAMARHFLDTVHDAALAAADELASRYREAGPGARREAR